MRRRHVHGLVSGHHEIPDPVVEDEPRDTGDGPVGQEERFLDLFAEPLIQRAVDYEDGRAKTQAALDRAAGLSTDEADHEIFSRTLQRGAVEVSWVFPPEIFRWHGGCADRVAEHRRTTGEDCFARRP
jgi:hypothetical protein